MRIWLYAVLVMLSTGCGEKAQPKVAPSDTKPSRGELESDTQGELQEGNGDLE